MARTTVVAWGDADVCWPPLQRRDVGAPCAPRLMQLGRRATMYARVRDVTGRKKVEEELSLGLLTGIHLIILELAVEDHIIALSLLLLFDIAIGALSFSLVSTYQLVQWLCFP